MILTLIEQANGIPTGLSLEMLTAARELAADSGAPLHALVVGSGGGAAAEQLGRYGVNTVHLVEDGQLDTYPPDAWASAIVTLVEKRRPAAVIGSGSDRANDVLARAAARLDLPMCANAREITAGDAYTITRVCWGGSLFEEVTLEAPCKLLTVAAHVFEPQESSAGESPTIEPVEISFSDADLVVRVVDQIMPEKEGISLNEANFVVGGGRGVGSTEGFGILEELAELVHGAVGCSRAVTSNGWRPHTDQIGQTGERIAPQLYMACGISGASQHMAGCSGAKNLLVVNTDKEAPILAKADYAVIGDLHEVIPAIIAEIERRGSDG